MKPQPKPLAGCSEQHMKGLLKRSDCFLCGDLDSFIVWPFVTRLCKTCFRKATQTEKSLLFSDVPSPLISSIPFAFINSDYGFVHFTSVANGATPVDQISKVYFTEKIKDVHQKLELARESGPQAVKTFFDGLEAEKAERLQDCEAWEEWYANVDEERGAVSETAGSNTPAHQESLLEAKHNLLAAPIEFQSQPAWSSSRPSSARPNANIHSRPGTSDPTVHKTADAINAVKATRRAEIERRCQQLDPPLSPRLLPHMESFQAAILIGNELTDNAWDVLKPRLLAQKPAAEEAERERAAAEEHLRSRANEEHPQEASLKEVREAADREWEESQRLIRKHLCDYADEIIRNMWVGGTNINKENSPDFAAGVLCAVRQRYFSDMAKGDTEVARLCETGELPRTLILDNMKYVYDTKVRPIAEEHRKDLFYCGGCESHQKAYGFEGVIQHYAAKHTSAFSEGNVVVHWHKAEWPDPPPFLSNPGSNVRPSTQHTNANHQRTHTPYQINYRPYQPPAPAPPPPQAYGPIHQPGVYGSNPMPGIYGSPNFGGYVGPTSPFSGHNPFPTPMSYTPVSPTGWTVPQRAVYSPALGPHTIQYSPAMEPPPMSGYQPGAHGPNFQQVQMDEVAKIGREIWFQTSEIKDIPPSVRVYAVIHHVVGQFRDRFSNEPNLDLFTDCLSSHPFLAPLKNVQGLACKTCVKYNEDLEDPQTSSPFKMGDRKLYPFHSLLSHFKRVHVERKLSTASRRGKSPEDERLDWKEDMIELPEPQFIESLVHAEGMDANKFNVLSEVFPEQFFGHYEERIAKIESTARDDGRVSAPPSRISSHQSHRSGPSHRDMGRMNLENQVRSGLSKMKSPGYPGNAEFLTDLVQISSPRPQRGLAQTDTRSKHGSQGTPSPASVNNDPYQDPSVKVESEADRFLANFVPGEDTSGSRMLRKRPSDAAFATDPVRRRSNPPYTTESPRSLGKRKSRDVELSTEQPSTYAMESSRRYIDAPEGFKRPRSQVYHDQGFEGRSEYWEVPQPYQPYMPQPPRVYTDDAGDKFVLIPRHEQTQYTPEGYGHPAERTRYASFVERTANRQPEQGGSARQPGTRY